jgi:hypothetical protein
MDRTVVDAFERSHLKMRKNGACLPYAEVRARMAEVVSRNLSGASLEGPANV